MNDLLMHRTRLLAANSIHLVWKTATTDSGILTFDTQVAAPIIATFGFSPVQAEGTPSPDNPLPFSGWTGCKVGLTGKNLFNKDAVIRGAYIGGGGGPHDNSNFGYAFVYVGGLSSVRVSGNKADNSAARYCCYDIYGNVLKNSDYKSNRTITLPSGTQKIAVTVYIAGNNKDIDTVQVEAGTTASAYEDYGTTTPITFTDPDSGNPLTVYGGTVTLNEDGSVDLVDDRIVFDPYVYLNRFVQGNGNVYIPPNSMINTVVAPLNVDIEISTDFKAMSPTSKTVPSFGLTADNTFAVNGANGITDTVANWKSFVTDRYNNGNPVLFLLRRKTPIAYHFDIGRLKSFLGTNNLWSDLNGGITAQYKDKQ